MPSEEGFTGQQDAEDIESPLTLAVLIGSSRKGRVGGLVAQWFTGQAALREFKIDVIDLAVLDLPLDLSETDDVREYRARIGAADAIVVVTPEYNHGYPAGLKLAIDLVTTEWAAKPVGFVSYGGLAGGLRSVEQLRAVFAELHTVTLRDVVSFHRVRTAFDENGTPRNAALAEQMATVLLDRLQWWGRALRTARAAVPYA